MLELDLELERGAFTWRVAARLEAPVVGVVGPSGAGKTTLLEAIAGLLPQARGRVALDEQVLQDGAGRWLPPEQRRIGVVFQDGRLFPHLSVRENLAFGWRAGGASREQVVEVLELGPLLERWPRSLSGGERQRVALGRALLSAPRLLLLDEPLAGVDASRKRRILELIARLRDAFRVPLLYVSHDLSEVLSLTDQLLLLEGGLVRGAGGLSDLLSAPESLGLVLRLGLDNPLEVELADAGPSEAIHARLGQARLQLPPAPEPARAGERWWVHLRPEDVVLAPRADGAPPPLLSARNQLAGEIGRERQEGGRVLLEVALPGTSHPVWAEVTPAAREALSLRPGAPVWCLFKTSALRWGARRP